MICINVNNFKAHRQDHALKLSALSADNYLAENVTKAAGTAYADDTN